MRTLRGWFSIAEYAFNRTRGDAPGMLLSRPLISDP